MINEEQAPDPIARAKELGQMILDLKWLVLLAGVVLSTLCIVAISLWPDTWQAETTVVVDPQKIPEKYASSSQSVDPARLTALSQEVLSASRMEQIVEELKILPKDSDQSKKDRLIESMLRDISVDVRSSGERGLGTFAITYTSGDPKMVAPIANRLAASFIQWSLDSREHQLKETAGLLSAQLREAKKELDGQEAKLSLFKADHAGKLPEQMATNSQALSHLQTRMQANADALNRLEQERILIVQSPEPGGGQPRNAPVTEATRLEQEQRKLEERLSDLRSRYSDEYPDVQDVMDRLAKVRNRLQVMVSSGASTGSATSVRLEIIGRDMKRLQEEQEKLTAQINRYQGLIDAAPVEQQQLVVLNREYQEAKDQYQSLLDKKHSADLAADLEGQRASDVFTIVDQARTPDAPIRPKRLILFAIAIPGSFLLSAIGIILLERFRGNVNTERELRFLLPEGVAILSRIPVIETPRYAKRKSQLAMFSISASLACVAAVAVFLWVTHPRLKNSTPRDMTVGVTRERG